ncbi:MAG: cyclic nucleotide-binding domain-containing protein [Kiloniellales bacterium]
MTERYQIAIVGSGPGGMSAGGRAAENGVSHVLLERTDHLSDTIFKYQKGKYVMATPDILPLRSPMDFAAGIREDVLGTWDRQTEALKVNVRYNAEVTAISGEKGDFELTINGRETIAAEYVILAIGLQGNLRKLEIEGADWERVQYQLDDPEEYEDETIVVVGAGDAAIENAVALAKQNRVIIVNRRDEFARAKQGNLSLITEAIDKGAVECFYSATPARVQPGLMVLNTPDGEAEVKCDRVIARLGATPPRRFVESCGIEFPSKDATALPELSAEYESNVPGLYVIGALGGYPLIKQAMNQGYEVVEFIGGNKVKPADEPLLEEKFGPLLQDKTVDDILQQIRDSMPILSGLTTLQLRELLIDSSVHLPAADTVIFERNEFTNTFYSIVDGEVDIHVDPDNPAMNVRLSRGEFFGEMGLIAGRRRTATAKAAAPSFLIETPRRTMIKLINSVPSVERAMNAAAMVRQLRTYLSPRLSDAALADALETAELKTFKAGEALFHEGNEGDGVHLIRKGSVTVSRDIDGQDIVLSYVAAGNYVGEMALLTDDPHNATVRAAIETETLWMEAAKFRALLDNVPELSAEIWDRMHDRLREAEVMLARPETGNIWQFLINEGIGEATDALLIDESLCVRCDNCEKACAETHGGTSRLNREAGPTYATIHVPTSCRHCEHPHCMADCPPDALTRAPNGEVYINDSCIGCGNCERNCPYGVIHMAYREPEKPSLLSWMLFGLGPGPGQDKAWSAARRQKAKAGDGGQTESLKLAVKCDMCKDIEGGAACVRACPTGAAIRVGPEELFSIANLAR